MSPLIIYCDIPFLQYGAKHMCPPPLHVMSPLIISCCEGQMFFSHPRWGDAKNAMGSFRKCQVIICNETH